jgi:oligopeptide transport system permease protein
MSHPSEVSKGTLPTTFWGRVAWHLRRDRLAMTGVTLVGLIMVAALLAPVLAPYPEELQDTAAILQRPSFAHPFGTDRLGRDVFSRVLYGARVSITVALVTSVFAMVFGTTLGAVSGWVGGRVDNVLMRFVDVLYSFPDLLLIIIISVVIGQGVVGIVASLSLVSWVIVARVVRGEVLALKERPFVESARAMGFGSARILVRHVLPHTVAPIMVTLTFRVPAVILAESTLSFIGLGLQPPASSWGVLAAQGWTAMSFYPHLVVFPSAAIFVTILAFNLAGDGLRDAMDVRA